jgi:hypothetical protein
MAARIGAQYPGEKEITFPPFTCLESDGDPRVERTEHGEIVIFPLKVAAAPRHHPRHTDRRTLSEERRCGGQASVNSKVETVEELQGRRKTLHLGMLRLGREDLVLALQAAYDAYAVPPASPPSADVLRMELILTACDRLILIAAPPALIPPSLTLSSRLLLHPAFRLIRLILIAPLFSRFIVPACTAIRCRKPAFARLAIKPACLTACLDTLYRIIAVGTLWDRPCCCSIISCCVDPAIAFHHPVGLHCFSSHS